MNSSKIKSPEIEVNVDGVREIKKFKGRFLSVNERKERSFKLDWNRKVHSSPTKVYRRFSEQVSDSDKQVSFS